MRDTGIVWVFIFGFLSACSKVDPKVELLFSQGIRPPSLNPTDPHLDLSPAATKGFVQTDGSGAGAANRYQVRMEVTTEVGDSLLITPSRGYRVQIDLLSEESGGGPL